MYACVEFTILAFAFFFQVNINFMFCEIFFFIPPTDLEA